MAKIIGLLILVAMLLRMSNCTGLENNCTEFNPCKNMAECLRYDADPNRVKCVCQRGFNGNLCEIWPKICSEDFCFNGGTCVLIKRIPRCLCQPSYNGLFCERNSFQSNDANNNYQLIGSPTSSSTASTTTVSYLTLHPSIYLTPNPNRMKQSICDFDPCLNFGQCLPITDRKSFFKFQCVCPDHYSGILCEKYSPPTSLPSTSFSSYTSSLRSSQSSLPNSFHFEQSTLKFLPDMSTHTYSYQVQIDRS